MKKPEMSAGPLGPAEIEELERLRKKQNPKKYDPDFDRPEIQIPTDEDNGSVEIPLYPPDDEKDRSGSGVTILHFKNSKE